MRNAWSSRLVVFILGIIAVGNVAAQDVKDEPGYVDLTDLSDLLGQSPDKEINIHGAMLRLVTAAARREDPELAELLVSLQGIFVRSFDLRRLDFDDVSRYVSLRGDKLEETGWEVFLKVRDRNEHVSMYVLIVEDEIAGVVLMSIDRYEDETVFLNIVGDIDPDQLSRIGDKFNIGGY